MTGCLTSLRRLQSRHIIRSPEVRDLVFAIGRETYACSVVSSTRGGDIMAERLSLTFGPFRRDLPQSCLWREAQPITLREGAPDEPHQPAQSGSRTGLCPVARGRVEGRRTTHAARGFRGHCATAYQRILSQS